MIAVVILCGPTNRLRDLAPLVPAAFSILKACLVHNTLL